MGNRFTFCQHIVRRLLLLFRFFVMPWTTTSPCSMSCRFKLDNGTCSCGGSCTCQLIGIRSWASLTLQQALTSRLSQAAAYVVDAQRATFKLRFARALCAFTAHRKAPASSAFSAGQASTYARHRLVCLLLQQIAHRNWL